MSSGAGAANNHGSSKKRVRTTTNTTTDAVSPHQRLRLNHTLFDSLGTRYATRYCGNSEELLELLRAAKVISSCQDFCVLNDTLYDSLGTRYCGDAEELFQLLLHADFCTKVHTFHVKIEKLAASHIRDHLSVRRVKR